VNGKSFLKDFILGIGFAWTMAAIVRHFRGEQFDVQPGTLAFSVTVYCSFAAIAVVLLLLRRTKYIGKAKK